MPAFAYIGTAVVVLSGASFLWTTVTSRRLLRRALGRRLRQNEESSIQAWMRIGEHEREDAAVRLGENPFESALDAIQAAATRRPVRRKGLFDDEADHDK
jgi:hypothetical protein